MILESDSVLSFKEIPLYTKVKGTNSEIINFKLGHYKITNITAKIIIATIKNNIK